MAQILPLVLVIATCIIGTTYGCSCFPESFAEKFLRAAYAVVVRVEDNGQIINERRVYRISRLATFKTNIPWPQVDQTHIYTAVQGSLCGITLARGNVYLITGYFSGPTDNPNEPLRLMQTSLCDIQQRWGWTLRGTIARLQSGSRRY